MRASSASSPNDPKTIFSMASSGISPKSAANSRTIWSMLDRASGPSNSAISAQPLLAAVARSEGRAHEQRAQASTPSSSGVHLWLGARRRRRLGPVGDNPEALGVLVAEGAAALGQALLHEGAHVPLPHLAHVRLQRVELALDGVGDVDTHRSPGRPHDPRLLQVPPRL